MSNLGNMKTFWPENPPDKFIFSLSSIVNFVRAPAGNREFPEGEV